MAFLFYAESGADPVTQWRQRDDRENVVLNWRLVLAIVLNCAFWAVLVFAARVLF